MANPVVASSSKAGGSGSAWNPATPTGTADGDHLLVICHSDESASGIAQWTPPAGYSALVPDGETLSYFKGGTTAGASYQAFLKTASGEGANVGTFTRTGGSGNSGVIAVRITGADTTTPIHKYAVSTFNSGDEGTSPDLTTIVNECLVIRFSTWNESKTRNAIPTGTTDIQWNDLSSNDGDAVYENQATAGSVGAKAWDLSSGTQTANFTMAFQPPQGGAGSQSISLPAVASAAALFAPVVTTGAVTVELPVIVSGTLYAPSVTTSVGVTLPHISDSDSLYAPSITVGAVTVSLPFIASSAALYSPTIAAGAVSLALPLLTNISDLFAPSVSPGAVGVSLPLIDSVAILYSPTVTPGAVSAALPFIDSTTVLYAPSIASDVILDLPHIDSVAALYSPSVSPGAVGLILPAIASTAALYSPSVAAGAVVIGLPAITDSDSLYAPSVKAVYALALPAIASTSSLYEPTVAYRVALPVISDPDSLYAPSVAPGAVSLLLPEIPSVSGLFTPQLNLNIEIPHLNDGDILYAPSLSYTTPILLPHIESDSILFPFSLANLNQEIILPFINVLQRHPLIITVDGKILKQIGNGNLYLEI